jgi:hypothetical protein
VRYSPRFQAQLGQGSPTERRDCGPRTVSMGIDAITHGQVRPGIPAIRERMGTPGNQTTNVYDAQRGVETYDHIPGRRPLHYRVLRDAASVKDAVRAGRPVHLCLDYGDFNESGATGDPNFTGGHSVLVVGQRVKDGEVQWRLFDPLDDHRRPSIPQGPRWVDRARLIHAAEAFAPSGVYAGVISGGQRHG